MTMRNLKMTMRNPSRARRIFWKFLHHKEKTANYDELKYYIYYFAAQPQPENLSVQYILKVLCVLNHLIFSLYEVCGIPPVYFLSHIYPKHIPHHIPHLSHTLSLPSTQN